MAETVSSAQYWLISLFQNVKCYYYDFININYFAMKISPRFTEFQVPTVVTLAGLDQIVSQPGRSPPLLYMIATA